MRATPPLTTRVDKVTSGMVTAQNWRCTHARTRPFSPWGRDERMGAGRRTHVKDFLDALLQVPHGGVLKRRRHVGPNGWLERARRLEPVDPVNANTNADEDALLLSTRRRV